MQKIVLRAVRAAIIVFIAEAMLARLIALPLHEGLKFEVTSYLLGLAIVGFIGTFIFVVMTLVVPVDEEVVAGLVVSLLLFVVSFQLLL